MPHEAHECRHVEIPFPNGSAYGSSVFFCIETTRLRQWMVDPLLLNGSLWTTAFIASTI